MKPFSLQWVFPPTKKALREEWFIQCGIYRQLFCKQKMFISKEI